jgi:pimeloyl-ACP methyl ester carboxylesterase
MNHQARAIGNLERRIHDAESDLFAAVGADVQEFYLDLARTGLRVRALSHGHGPPVVLLHGVSESAAIWAPLFTKLGQFRLLAVDLPGQSISPPASPAPTAPPGRPGPAPAPWRKRHGWTIDVA